MSTMHAALIREHGGPEVLEVVEVERPVPKSGEVLVRVGACALNHLDIFVRRGMPGMRFSFPHVSGGDVAGWVEAAGDAAGEHLVGGAVLIDPLVGDHALGEGPWGGLADFIVVPAQNVISIDAPDAELERYAALPIAYGTAYRMLFSRARLQPGETMVVLGASGGVGVACVQFGSRIGARIIACSSSDEKLARLRALGADATINTAREDFSRRAWELTGKQGADVVVDYNGRDTWPGSIRCTRHGGRLVTCGATTGYEATTDLRYVWTRELTILGSDGWTRDDLLAIVELVRSGEISPVIHGIFPLSRIREAEAVIEERRAFGKVVVIPDGVWDGRG
ncbi:MAG TPA: zinc-binding dehydrogenase [Chloroflexota bacterium]|nr:zinc-binding dehydrogenase [Chloroflexota bacterium]